MLNHHLLNSIICITSYKVIVVDLYELIIIILSLKSTVLISLHYMHLQHVPLHCFHLSLTHIFTSIGYSVMLSVDLQAVSIPNVGKKLVLKHKYNILFSVCFHIV